MVVTPLIRYKAPHYPDKQTAMKDPLLLKNLPRRWAGRAATVTAVTATAAMMLTGCAAGEETSDAASIASVSAETNPASSLLFSTAASSETAISSKAVSVASSKAVSSRAVSVAPVIINDMIAPLFIHGEGRGSFGCSMVAPAVFLTEQEATSIIKDALNAAGIEQLTEPPIIKTQIPLLNLSGFKKSSEENQLIEGYKLVDLRLDGVDVNGDITFEFISQKDIEAWDANKFVTNSRYMSSTVSDYDFQATAKAFNQKLNNIKTDYIIATFYDPVTRNEVTNAARKEYSTSYDAEKYIQTVRAETEKDLRLQVTDFIAWLKAEEII